MKTFSLSTLAIGTVLSMSGVALAECVQDSNGTIYSCGGSPQWNFETGKWTCTNSVNGQTVSGDTLGCTRGGGGRDAGADDDLLEPLVTDGGKPKKGPIPPGDPRKKIQQPK